MIITETRNIETQVEVAKKCDVCKHSWPVEYLGEDRFEAQEFIHVRTAAGYGNRYFEDMSTIELDLCQDCFHTLLGQYARVTKTDRL